MPLGGFGATDRAASRAASRARESNDRGSGVSARDFDFNAFVEDARRDGFDLSVLPEGVSSSTLINEASRKGIDLKDWMPLTSSGGSGAMRRALQSYLRGDPPVRGAVEAGVPAVQAVASPEYTTAFAPAAQAHMQAAGNYAPGSMERQDELRRANALRSAMIEHYGGLGNVRGDSGTRYVNVSPRLSPSEGANVLLNLIGGYAQPYVDIDEGTHHLGVGADAVSFLTAATPTPILAGLALGQAHRAGGRPLSYEITDFEVPAWMNESVVETDFGLPSLTAERRERAVRESNDNPFLRELVLTGGTAPGGGFPGGGVPPGGGDMPPDHRPVRGFPWPALTYEGDTPPGWLFRTFPDFTRMGSA